MDAGRVGTRLGRLILLACTLIGLAAMHTLGHSDRDRHTPGHAVAGAMTSVAGMPEPTPCPAGYCHLQWTGSDQRSGGMDSWSVCLAIITGWSILILVAAALRSASGIGLLASWRALLRPVTGRAPPFQWVGLRLAALSVMRT